MTSDEIWDVIVRRIKSMRVGETVGLRTKQDRAKRNGEKHLQTLIIAQESQMRGWKRRLYIWCGWEGCKVENREALQTGKRRRVAEGASRVTMTEKLPLSCLSDRAFRRHHTS